MNHDHLPYAWFVSARDAEIATWVDDNLPDSFCHIGKKTGNKRSIVVHFGSEMDETLFILRWRSLTF